MPQKKKKGNRGGGRSGGRGGGGGGGGPRPVVGGGGGGGPGAAAAAAATAAAAQVALCRANPMSRSNRELWEGSGACRDLATDSSLVAAETRKALAQMQALEKRQAAGAVGFPPSYLAGKDPAKQQRMAELTAKVIQQSTSINYPNLPCPPSVPTIILEPPTDDILDGVRLTCDVDMMDADGSVTAREIEGMELMHGIHIEDARSMYSRQDGIDSMRTFAEALGTPLASEGEEAQGVAQSIANSTKASRQRFVAERVRPKHPACSG